ncbi:MAG TPA: aminotransferase class I/II-fold pyridoxal phosphate-dependent enzyme [Terriglobales bacterium]|jgi:histidinol-phosphate aminotransferase|nr:aminotransferase class I/II-fold pyridoxal phosphate-dependent enzyme [Terriglobales bacterium]
MFVSRRNFLRTVGIGAAAGVALQPSMMSAAPLFEPMRPRDLGGPIRLNSNENAYGPSPKTTAAIRTASAEANRYPFDQYEELVEQIAKLNRVRREQVLMGCGSTEILRIAAAAFLSKGKQLIQASPTFEALEHYARANGAEVVSVPLDKQFEHDLDSMLARVSSSTALVYICNPNNPSASITPRKDLEIFIGNLPSTCHVLIDEAYHHFAGQSPVYASFLDHPIDNERLIVARTFSKVYGLAGLRLGYGIASHTTARQMEPYLTEDSVNGIVVRAATVALADTESVNDFIKRNAEVRENFFNQAKVRGLKPIDSQANFVMMDTGHPAQESIEHFRKNNILIGRRFPAMDTYIRVSLGTPEEMKEFWRAWDLMPNAATRA